MAQLRPAAPAAPAAAYEVELLVPRSWLLTSNQRHNRWEKGRSTRALRQASFIAKRNTLGGLRLDGRWRCVVHVAWPNRRARDAANLQPTVKACIDGIVGDGGLLPDDSDAHLEGPDIRPAGVLYKQDGVACRLVFEFTPAPPEAVR